MRIRVAVPEEHVSPHVIDAALEAVTRLDESLIRSGDSPTSHELVAKGARWRPEPMGDEHFDHGGIIASRGHGDCDDWAPLHAATLRASGEDPGATARIIPSGPSTYHAVVQRSDGHIEAGSDDISVRAGMKPLERGYSVIGGGEAIEVYACDPHDGRIYQGSLLPTVGPLAIHCGPQMSVRTNGAYFEGRCDLPIRGCALVGMRHRGRRHVRHHGRHRRVRGVPYAFSATAMGETPESALSQAIIGAILCGDASEQVTALDRYKLLAAQAALSSMPAAAIQQSLVDCIVHDIQKESEATGQHPQAFLEHLRAELHGQGFEVHPNAVSIADAIVRNAGLA
jgi:hypothetical protein